MNAAYAYDTWEASSLITNRIYYLLESHNWSIKTLSDESNIPYETLKKLLSRKTENTSFHNIMKIALAFKCNLNDLVEPLEDDVASSGYLGELEHSVDFCTPIQETLKVPVLNPLSLYDREIPEFLYANDTIDTLSIPCPIQQDIGYGIRISSFCYHPVYQDGDILLISRKRAPQIGETGIFLHHGKVHIRLLYKTWNHIILKSVNGLGPDIAINDFSAWRILGYVAGVQRAHQTYDY